MTAAIGAGSSSINRYRSRSWYRYRQQVPQRRTLSQDSRKQKVRFPKHLLLGCALAEATAIYGFVIGLLILFL